MFIQILLQRIPRLIGLNVFQIILMILIYLVVWNKWFIKENKKLDCLQAIQKKHKEIRFLQIHLISSKLEL